MNKPHRRFLLSISVFLLTLCGHSFGQKLDNATLARFDHRIKQNVMTWGNRVTFTGKQSIVIAPPKLSAKVSGDGKFVVITPKIHKDGKAKW